MKILLLGEYSNVHATLAVGLRILGHEVTVVSNGDFWKDYPRDISLARRPGKLGGLLLMAKICSILPKLRGYDVVQLINPMFVELKAERIFSLYNYLRRHNGKIFLGGFGMDWYWVNTCRTQKPLRYSDFNIGNELRTNRDALKEVADWHGTAKERLNKYIAEDCDGIITGLYEYWTCYNIVFPEKTVYIPFPIRLPDKTPAINARKPLNLFIGINKTRSEYKGTDIMLQAAKDITKRYPDMVKLNIAESIPFAQYEKMMNSSDAILDQLYSYTPSMNSLLAMSKGIICIGGGEEENYEIINEKELRPIINVEPTYESVYNELEKLVLHPEHIPELKRQSIEYIKRHHEYVGVARKYEEFYKK
ncbi:MAG: glycosyltransferase family 1 protein [Prevotella sp.]|nr:glycosyltransferase family 1 protein [Prevotella sp.]